jgi:hypothetical protein
MWDGVVKSGPKGTYFSRIEGSLPHHAVGWKSFEVLNLVLPGPGFLDGEQCFAAITQHASMKKAG